jgi:phosphoribosyl-dephospho-CoA transferase
LTDQEQLLSLTPSNKIKNTMINISNETDLDRLIEAILNIASEREERVNIHV